jgi:hypothetical protein
MNLRVQSGLAHSRLTLDAISVSTLPYGAGYAGSVKLKLLPIPHRPARLELRFQFPTGPSLGKECGPVRSVEASAKLAEICGFHQGWCINPRMLIYRLRLLAGCYKTTRFSFKKARFRRKNRLFCPEINRVRVDYIGLSKLIPCGNLRISTFRKVRKILRNRQIRHSIFTKSEQKVNVFLFFGTFSGGRTGFASVLSLFMSVRQRRAIICNRLRHLRHLRWGQLPSAGPRQKKGAGSRVVGTRASG